VWNCHLTRDFNEMEELMATEQADRPREQHQFEADVSRLLYMMVHSVYSDKQVFLRELISNAADACEKLRYEAIADPSLMADGSTGRIRISLDEESRTLTVEDNGIGMGHDELIDALGTIARSGTRAFMEQLEAANGGEKAELIGQFGVGFYSSFMVADRVDVVTRRAGQGEAWMWSSDGKGSYAVNGVDLSEAPARGTRVVLHLMEDAKSFTNKWTVERIVREQSGHVPVPIEIVEKPGAEPSSVSDGSALWTKSKSDISDADYADFYRGIAGQYDEPALTVHFRAEGRHEYTALAFVPGSQPFDLFDSERKGRMKLYVRRVFITDDAELLPRYLRFVRGLVDTADLPLNISREMIQDSPILAAIRKGLTSRILTSLEKLAETENEKYDKLWEHFGSALKEGLYDDFERRAQLLGLARFRTSASGEGHRSLADYVKDMKPSQKAIYYLAGGNLEQLKASPQVEGFRARGVEVLYLTDPVDSFWAPHAPEFDGKGFKSITQGATDLDEIEIVDGLSPVAGGANEAVQAFIKFAKDTLAEDVADVRASNRLTESAVCLVAADAALDRQMERLLQGAGRLQSAEKPVLEVNPGSDLIKRLAENADNAFRTDAAWLLLEQARILDGDKPNDPRLFAERLARLFSRALGDVVNERVDVA
jgi:molecular chaperone HtpG